MLICMYDLVCDASGVLCTSDSGLTLSPSGTFVHSVFIQKASRRSSSVYGCIISVALSIGCTLRSRIEWLGRLKCCAT